MTRRAPKVRVIAYDVSEDMDNLALRCPKHGNRRTRGVPLYAGDEWGGTVPPCERCGAAIVGLIIR